jgi:hypothetical protein
MAKVIGIKVKKEEPKSMKAGPNYVEINPKSSQNDVRARTNLHTALNYKKSLTTGEKSTKPVYDPKSGSQTSKSVSPKEVQKADSVISASRKYLKINPKK